jgi:murein L,D-transpeptidase YcbB/YkuD
MQTIRRYHLAALTLCLAPLCLVTCARTDTAPSSSARPQQVTTFAPQVLSPEGVTALHAIADSGKLSDMHWPDFGPYKAEFDKFYGTNSYGLVWIQGGRPRAQALAIIDVLKDAGAKGLDPEDYDGSRWADRLTKLSQSPTELDLIHFDAALTVSTARYVRAVHIGRVNPKQFDFQLDVEDRRINLGDFFQSNLVNAADPAAVIEKLEPTFPGYKRLLALLPIYSEIAKKDDGEKLLVPAKTILPGQPYESLPRLGRFLQLIMDIPANVQLPENPTVYDGVFVDGVKHYQARHGEDVTGKLDARTVNELNTPSIDRIKQIKLTLERWRWLPHTFNQAPIIVNLPEYRLRAMNPDGTVAFYKNVIVGKAYGHKSPVFQKDIKYVIFRPYWQVTPSIQRNEIVPHILKDSNYIARNNFEITTATGELVTDNAVSPEVLEGVKSFRLRVRQKPGPTNSLGLVKIIFPNSDNVYLHGTDVPELFSQSVRDFSHGCIRVEKPANLAAWVLRNNPGWDLERVTQTMNGEQNNIQVNLTTTIPVLIVYGTVTVNEENQLRFFDDIYGYDAKLEAALAKGYPYPW